MNCRASSPVFRALGTDWSTDPRAALVGYRYVLVAVQRGRILGFRLARRCT